MPERCGLDDEAARLRSNPRDDRAVILTSDVGGTATTDDVTATIIDRLEPAGYADGGP